MKTPESTTEYALSQYQMQGSLGVSAVITAAPAKEWNATRTPARGVIIEPTSGSRQHEGSKMKGDTQKRFTQSRKCWSSVVGLAAFH